jgi:pimeloyl-ACP methyl ester carboxylesterase
VPVLKSFADGQLFGGTWGQGPATVLALHGWRRTHQDFSAVFDPLPGNRPDPAHPAGLPGPSEPALSAIAPDLFGFGATPPPPEPWGSAEYASHLLALFDQPGLLAERVVLVGHSFGGRVSIPLVGLVPDRIERVVLTAVPLLDRQGRRSKPATAYRLGRRLHRMGLVGERRMEEMRNRYGSPDYRAAEGVMRDVFVRLLAEQYADGMAAVACPVDLVWGDRDDQVPLEVAERAQPLFPSARLLTLPGVGHLTPTEAPDALRTVITSGVAGPPSSTPPASTAPSSTAPSSTPLDGGTR